MAVGRRGRSQNHLQSQELLWETLNNFLNFITDLFSVTERGCTATWKSDGGWGAVRESQSELGQKSGLNLGPPGPWHLVCEVKGLGFPISKTHFSSSLDSLSV